jgi:TPR repeat protein
MKRLLIVVIAVVLDVSIAYAQSDIEKLRTRAEAGDAAAQNSLGMALAEGQGVAKDEAEAVFWYRKAADQGLANAQWNLGKMYRDGLGGLKQDDSQAVVLFRKAAEQGDAAAQNSLGFMYEQGRGGLAQDYAQSVLWYRKSAEQSFPAGENNLGRMYEDGRGGLPKDSAQAASWYRKAADKGDANGQANLGKLYLTGQGVQRDYVKGVELIRKAAEQGNSSAQASLGYAFQNGRGVPKDDVQAEYWDRKSAEQNDDAGLNNLAWLYATSENPKIRNPQLAVEYALKAVAGDSEDSGNQDTLAAAYYANGQYEKAVESERQAIALASPHQKAKFEATLAKYERAVKEDPHQGGK